MIANVFFGRAMSHAPGANANIVSFARNPHVRHGHVIDVCWAVVYYKPFFNSASYAPHVCKLFDALFSSPRAERTSR